MVLEAMSKPRETTSYSPFGNVLDGQLARRGIRSNAELARRIKAKKDYPRSITDETIRNYKRGQHNVPWDFLQYAVLVMEDAQPLTDFERKELEHTFTWGQKPPEDSPISPENLERKRAFIEGVESGEISDGDTHGGSS